MTENQLKVVFKSDGSIKTFEFPKYATQGSSGVMKLTIALDGGNIQNYSAIAHFTLPNGEQGQQLAFNIIESSVEVYGETYLHALSLYLTQAQTYLAGVLKCSIEVLNTNGSVLYTYACNITVNPTSYDPDSNEAYIKNAQYKQLVQTIDNISTGGGGGGGTSMITYNANGKTLGDLYGALEGTKISLVNLTGITNSGYFIVWLHQDGGNGLYYAEFDKYASGARTAQDRWVIRDADGSSLLNSVLTVYNTYYMPYLANGNEFNYDEDTFGDIRSVCGAIPHIIYLRGTSSAALSFGGYYLIKSNSSGAFLATSLMPNGNGKYRFQGTATDSTLISDIFKSSSVYYKPYALLSDVQEMAIDDVVKHQATATIVINALTNINGKDLTTFQATASPIGISQEYIRIRKVRDNSYFDLTEEEAKDYMKRMSGTDYLPPYNYDYPRNSFWIMADGTFWKPQYIPLNSGTSYDGLYLFKIPNPFVVNPMTARGDLIVGGVNSGNPTRLAKGTAGQVLRMKSNGLEPEWGTPQNVVANPTLEGTETDLSSLDVNGTKYKVITETQVSSMIASKVDESSIASEYSEHTTYVVGDLVWHEGTLYRCTTLISGGETWDSSHWAETKIVDSIDDKVKKLHSSNKVYVTVTGGNDASLDYSKAITANAIVQRDVNGYVLVPNDPSNGQAAVNKNYVDAKVSGVYRFQGTYTVSQLNVMASSFDGSMNGYVYNVADSGTLSNGSVQVSAGDNVAIYWVGNTFIWDKLSGAFTVDLTNYYTKAETDEKFTIIAPAYDSTLSYKVGDLCIYNGTLYKCNNIIHTGGETWNSSHWDAIKVSNEFTRKIDIAKEYDPTGSRNYAYGSLVYHDNKLYRCIVPINAAEDWTSSKWTEATLADEIVNTRGLQIIQGVKWFNDNLVTRKLLSYQHSSLGLIVPDATNWSADKTISTIEDNEITYFKQSNVANEYNPASSYAIGAFVFHEGLLYRCSTTIGIGGEAWDATHWTLTRLDNSLLKTVGDQVATNKITLTNFYTATINSLDENGFTIKLGNGEKYSFVSTYFEADGDETKSLGRRYHRWTDLYMTGKIKDGTNEISITDLAALIAYAKAQGWIS